MMAEPNRIPVKKFRKTTYAIKLFIVTLIFLIFAVYVYLWIDSYYANLESRESSQSSEASLDRKYQVLTVSKKAPDRSSVTFPASGLHGDHET